MKTWVRGGMYATAGMLFTVGFTFVTNTHPTVWTWLWWIVTIVGIWILMFVLRKKLE